MELLHRHRVTVIHLEEDVYVVLGDPTRPGTLASAWRPPGTYGPVPREAAVGMLGDVLGALGPELWRAKREGDQVRLDARLDTYDAATVLRWGADCVEHLARRVRAVDGNVAEVLVLARRYADDREFDAANAHRLADEAKGILDHLRKGGAAALGRAVASRVAQLGLGCEGDLLNPTETRYEAGEYATADLRSMQVALMHATGQLCQADPLLAGREAAAWCRRAAARRALTQEAEDRANGANESSWLNLLLNPFASGTLARSLPGQVKAIQDGGDPEAAWQAQRLHAYTERSDDSPLAPPTPW